MITRATIDAIMQATRIDQVIASFVTLKKLGANLIGCCPFHNENTPSFTVSPQKNIYKCFGCGRSGDTIAFLCEHETEFTYPTALKWLANFYNIPIEETVPTPAELEAQNKREAAYNVLKYASDYYIQTLQATPPALHYLQQRGITPHSINAWQIGFAPAEWDALTRKAMQDQYLLPTLMQAGLTTRKEADEHNPEKHYDRFRNRIIFPIHTLSGRVAGFGARIIIPDERQPKYLNSPDSETYSKSYILYGLYQAKKHIAEKDEALLTEGYTDVISFHQAGLTNTVCSSGTSLTVPQINLIKRFTNNLNLIFDADKAGINAAMRGIETAIPHGLNIYITPLPTGHDPDSFARAHSPEQVLQYIADNRTDFIRFKLNHLLPAAGTDPAKLQQVAQDIINTISLTPDAITRHHQAQIAAQALNLPVDIVQARIKSIPTQPPPPTAEQAPVVFPPEESQVIKLLLNYGNCNINYTHTQGTFTGTVATFILQSFHDDREIMQFNHPDLGIIFGYFRSNPWSENVADAIKHMPNRQIQSAAISHFNINDNADEPPDLVNTVVTAIQFFQLKRIRERKKKTQQLLKDSTSLTPTVQKLLTQIQNDNHIITTLSKILGIPVMS